MSIKSIISVGTMLFLLGAVAPGYTQQGDKRQQSRPTPQQAQPQRAQQAQPQRVQQAQPQHVQQAQPQAKPQQAQPQATQHPQTAARPAQTAQRSQQTFGGVYHGGVKAAEPTNGGVHPSGVPQHQGQARTGFLQSRAGSWNTEHQTWQQRGGYNGYRIPDARFRLFFGGGHFFRIGGLPLLYVGGYPRFQYDGYWVTFMDPWPEMWPPLWYETDNVYLDWGGDGYYLYDSNYPGMGIAVMISF
jgi:hypothetical protein